MIQYKSRRGECKLLKRVQHGAPFIGIYKRPIVTVTDIILIKNESEIILEKRQGILFEDELEYKPIGMGQKYLVNSLKIYKDKQNGEPHLSCEFLAFNSDECFLLYKALGLEFLGQAHINSISSHEGLLQQIFNRKITNLKGVSKFILKNELGITDFRGYNLGESAIALMTLTPNKLISIFNNCQNVQDLIKNENLSFCLELSGRYSVVNGDVNDFDWALYHDCFSLCCDFNVKFNFKWSKSKLREIHDKLTKEKMRVKLEKTDTTPVNYPVSFPVIDNVSLIDSEPKCYLEAKRQHNCIYSNYWSKIKSRTYVVLGVDIHNVHISVGISKLLWLTDKRVDQIYRACNVKPTTDELDFVNNIMKRKDIQAFLNNAFQ